MSRTDTDHILPRSRVAPEYRDIEGLNASWNLHEVDINKHRAKHVLFGDYFPWEIEGVLRKYAVKTGSIKTDFFRLTSREDRRHEAWGVLFGESYDINDAIRVIREEWDLDSAGYVEWKKLKARIKNDGSAIYPPGWKMSPRKKTQSPR